jgi:predicted lysophospholipase L1 biosynthesis ABC-type transport system permease subunit
VIAYVVSQRRREIGIRAALGAQQGELKGRFVRHALVLAGIGIVIGLGAAAALTRLISTVLYGVTPLDPVTYAAVPVVLVIATVLASYVPARRGICGSRGSVESGIVTAARLQKVTAATTPMRLPPRTGTRRADRPGRAS